MSETSEEKSFAASQKKLRDSRRKGRVPQSRDFASGFSVLAIFAYLYVGWPGIFARILELIETIADNGISFEEKLARSLQHSFMTIFLVLGPAAVIALVCSIFFGVISTFGPVFSFETIKPQFEHINPAKGFQRIFGLRNVIEFTKGLVKIIFFVGLFAVVIGMWMESLFLAPGCGEACIGPVVKSMLAPFGIAAALCFILIGLIDLPLQRWLFSRDMRMTKTEMKREHKDAEGDPLLRQRLKSQRKEFVSQPGKRGIGAANMAFTWRGKLVAIRYVEGQMEIPIVVEKGRDEEVILHVETLISNDIPIIEDKIAALLYKANIGEPIPRESFDVVARHIYFNFG